jgi:hypothetical protein
MLSMQENIECPLTGKIMKYQIRLTLSWDSILGRIVAALSGSVILLKKEWYIVL